MNHTTISIQSQKGHTGLINPNRCICTTESIMTIEEQIRTIPDAVQQVVAAWKANAIKAGMSEDACYVGFDANESRTVKVFYVSDDGAPDYRYEEIEGPAWEVTCNYERGPILFWFTEQDVWLYAEQYAEGCSRMKGGLLDAIATAEIVYTG